VFPVRYELGFYIPEVGILHGHRRENLRSYIALTGWTLHRRRNMFPVRYELSFYIPEDDILHSHCRESLRSYIALTGWALHRRRNMFPVRYELSFYIPEDDILHSRRSESLKCYIDPKEFWQWCITQSLGIVLCPSSGILNTRRHSVSESESASVLR
jgi:hypothetical protein